MTPPPPPNFIFLGGEVLNCWTRNLLLNVVVHYHRPECWVYILKFVIATWEETCYLKGKSHHLMTVFSCERLTFRVGLCWALCRGKQRHHERQARQEEGGETATCHRPRQQDHRPARTAAQEVHQAAAGWKKGSQMDWNYRLPLPCLSTPPSLLHEGLVSNKWKTQCVQSGLI